MTNDLVAFMHARLDEDEQVAQAAAAPHGTSRMWFVQPWYDGTNQRCDLNSSCGPLTHHGGIEVAPAEHAARHDPARVLAEVEAKRRIVELHGDQHECASGADAYEYPYTGCETLRLLALPEADHPDYRQEWRP